MIPGKGRSSVLRFVLQNGFSVTGRTADKKNPEKEHHRDLFYLYEGEKIPITIFGQAFFVCIDKASCRCVF